MEEVNPSRGTVECGEGLPLLDGVQEARAEQGTGVTEEVCRDNGVLWMQLPDEGDRVKHLLWVAEEAAEGSRTGSLPQVCGGGRCCARPATLPGCSAGLECVRYG